MSDRDLPGLVTDRPFGSGHGSLVGFLYCNGKPTSSEQYPDAEKASVTRGKLRLLSTGFFRIEQCPYGALRSTVFRCVAHAHVYETGFLNHFYQTLWGQCTRDAICP